MNYSVLRSGLGWQLALTGCSVGTTQVTLGANTLTDQAGNTGPLVALASNVESITPDEIVNQIVNPTTPSGTHVDIPQDRLEVLSKGSTNAPTKQKPTQDSAGVLSKPVAKDLVKEGKQKVVITAPQQQSFLIALGLSAVALLLASVAAGSQLRSRRKKH
jgi:hypothetical protein